MRMKAQDIATEVQAVLLVIASIAVVGVRLFHEISRSPHPLIVFFPASDQ